MIGANYIDCGTVEGGGRKLNIKECVIPLPSDIDTPLYDLKFLSRERTFPPAVQQPVGAYIRWSVRQCRRQAQAPETRSDATVASVSDFPSVAFITVFLLGSDSNDSVSGTRHDM